MAHHGGLVSYHGSSGSSQARAENAHIPRNPQGRFPFTTAPPAPFLARYEADFPTAGRRL
jgi:hypothetical protein